jgi:hypothetical protein
MAIQLTARQQAQLAFLERLPPKLAKVKTIVEQMGGGSLDETAVRSMIRMLDEIKAGASQLSINGFADAAGAMAAMARRGGGLQVKVRGLRDALVSVKTNYDAAIKKASVELPEAERGAGEAPAGG